MWKLASWGFGKSILYGGQILGPCSWCFQHRAPHVALLNQWSWPFEPVHWILGMIQHCWWYIYIKISEFHVFNSMRPLPLLSNFGTAFITQFTVYLRDRLKTLEKCVLLVHLLPDFSYYLVMCSHQELFLDLCVCYWSKRYLVLQTLVLLARKFSFLWCFLFLLSKSCARSKGCLSTVPPPPEKTRPRPPMILYAHDMILYGSHIICCPCPTSETGLTTTWEALKKRAQTFLQSFSSDNSYFQPKSFPKLSFFFGRSAQIK